MNASRLPNRRLIRALSVLLLLAMLLAIVFVTAHAGHQCAREHCAICLQLVRLDGLLRLFALVLVLSMLLPALRVAGGRALFCGVHPATACSPVLRFDQLNN